jgi:ketosteroid isomerase-like protein
MHRHANETFEPRRPIRSLPNIDDAAVATAIAGDERGMRSTREVIENHLARFAARDLDGILSDYAPSAVLFTPDGPLRGLDSIRALFEAMLAEFAKPGARFELGRLSVEGDHGFIVWTAETAENVYELGTDTFVVRDGRIQVQSFAGKIAPKR